MTIDNGEFGKLGSRFIIDAMADKIIDLRSDTVTKPSAAMRRAMAEAEVGDDVYMEDPTVNRLQARAAETFGREAGLFVPSGSMGNLTCIMAQTERGQEVICEAAGHIYNYEMASMSALAGVLPRVIPTADGIMTWEQIAPAIREKTYTRPQTALVALENTHNMAGGTVYPSSLAELICDQAHAAGLRVHLDGARVFNAAVFLGQSVAQVTKKFDSVQFCFSKGLGAPVGSMIRRGSTFDSSTVERPLRLGRLRISWMRGARRSASTSTTRAPFLAIEAARFTATVVLPSSGTALETMKVFMLSSRAAERRSVATVLKRSAISPCSPSAVITWSRSRGITPRRGSPR